MKKYKVLEEEINQLRQDRISKQDECKLISKNLEEIKSEINNTLLQAKEKENEVNFKLFSNLIKQLINEINLDCKPCWKDSREGGPVGK